MTYEEFHIMNRVKQLNYWLNEFVYTMQFHTSANGRKEVRIYRYGELVARGRIYCKNYIERRIKEYEDSHRNDK